jgi:DNA-binding NarL/FixJ family response regulator
MRLTVADDSALYRDLLVSTLTSNGHVVVGEAANADELLAGVDAAEPDVVLADIRMPPTYTDDGLRAAVRIRRRHPHIGVVLLSHYGEVEYALRLVEALPDRAGYLLKDRATGAPELLDTIQRVAAGGLVIDPAVVGRLMARRRRDNPLQHLTERELEALRLMAVGLSNGAIARQMKVTTSTVEKHATALFRKLGLSPDLSTSTAEINVRVRAVLTYLRHTGQLPGPGAH